MTQKRKSYGKGSKNCKPAKKKCVRRSHEFTDNQYTADMQTDFTSSSAKKLSSNREFDVKVDETFSYCILAFNLVFSALAELLKCKICNSDVKFTQTNVRGLGFKINIECQCGDRTINSCPMINTGNEINRRIVFVLRLLGVGIHGVRLFCSLMELSSNFNVTRYYYILENIKIATHAVSEACLKKAGEEEKEENKENNMPEDELTVSGDGTWSKRGYSSLIGVTTLIGKYSSKILDCFVSSKTCKTCEVMRKKLNPVEFEIFYESEHREECSANYEGSSRGMEVQGIIEMFKNSEELHHAKYAYYIGDGDSKTFTNLSAAKPYGDFVVQKLECVLHVGKRMYRHLKDVKKTLVEMRKIKKAEEKKKKPEEEKKPKKAARKPRNKRNCKAATPVTPTDKTTDLTGKVMKQMSINYSLAIQRYPDSLAEMKREIWAGFYHMISTDAEPQHTYCNSDWCKYLKAQDGNVVFKHKPALSAEVQELVKPVFEQLTDEKLLRRCLGKNTQNNNECYNKTLWALVPKSTFVGLSVTEIAVQISLATFNEGRITLLKMMEIMGCTIGRYAYDYALRKDDERIAIAEKATKAATKEGRIKHKERQKDEQMEYERSGLLLYGAGIAD
ncbi:hypothetical protein TKK_0015538 [Trichogramma kaykai]